MGLENLASEINETVLINKFAAEDEKLKLKPADENQAILRRLLSGDTSAPPPAHSRLSQNFNYFQTRITAQNYQAVRAGLAKLIFVEISLDRDKDDAQRIFESLNSTGLDLSSGDLIRNAILMGLNSKDQKRIYKDYWQVIEENAQHIATNTSRVSDFIRDYLTLKNKQIPKQNRVYEEFKKKHPIKTLAELEPLLTELRSLSYQYAKLLNPSTESDPELRRQLVWIEKLEIKVSYVFLMQVFNDFNEGKIDKPTLVGVLELVQAYVWRRFVVGLATNALNKVFMSLYRNTEAQDYLASFQRALLEKTGSARFPSDNEFVEALRIKDVYTIKPHNRSYLFDRLENHNNRERVLIDSNPDITIEHIFPQHPDRVWNAQLGKEEFDFIRESCLHTLANLTLSGNNRELGNKSFTEKRDLAEKGYRASRLWLNRDLAQRDRWDRAALEARFLELKARALDVWKRPQPPSEAWALREEVNIFDVGDPTNKKLAYAVFLGEKLAFFKTRDLYLHVLQRLFERQPALFFETNLYKILKVTPHQESLRSPAPLGDSHFIETSSSNIHKFDRLKEVLQVFELEDELRIKFTDPSPDDVSDSPDEDDNP